MKILHIITFLRSGGAETLENQHIASKVEEMRNLISCSGNGQNKVISPKRLGAIKKNTIELLHA